MAEDYVEIQGEAGVLFVKISENAGSPVAGKWFAIPEQLLAQLEFTTKNEAEFMARLKQRRINVDYAIFWPDLVAKGSAGG